MATEFDDLIRKSAAQFGVPEPIAFGLFATESNFNPRAVGPNTRSGNAIGIAQFMPSTAKEMGVDPTKPDQAIPGAMRYLRQQFDAFGGWEPALAAYNWGPNNMRLAGTVEKVPSTVRGYISKVMGGTQPAPNASGEDYSRYFPSNDAQPSGQDFSRYFPAADYSPVVPQPTNAAIGQDQMRQSVKAEAESRPLWEQGFAGAGAGIMKMGQAIGELMPDSLLNRLQDASGRLRQSVGLSAAPSTPTLEEVKALGGATTATQVGEVAGPALASMAIPAGVVGPVANALGVAARPVFQRAVPRIIDMGLSTGLFTGLTTPGTFEDRAKAGAAAGATSMVLPAGISGVQAVRRVTTRPGARLAAAEAIGREVGEQARPGLPQALTQPYAPAAVTGARPTAAQVTGNPALAVLESGSRTRRADQWIPLDRFNAQARWDALAERAGTPDDLARMISERAAATTPMREGALNSASFAIRQAAGDVTDVIQPIVSKLDDLATGANRPNASVQTLVQFVRGELAQGTSPAQLYTVRKMLTDGIKASPTSELSQAARAARPERVQIVKMIDDALDDLSSGTWSRYMRRYAAESGPVTSREAMQNIQRSLGRGLPEGVAPSTLGTSAAWKTIGNLRDRFGQKMFGSQTLDRLLPEDRAFLGMLQRDLYDSSLGITAQATRGSPTAPLTEASKRAEFIGGLIREAGGASTAPVRGMLGGALDSVTRRADEELVGLLQDPRALAAALEAAERAQLVRAASSRAGRASGVGYGNTR